MGIPNYQKASVIETHGDDPQFITVYNDSTVVANGAIKVLSPKWITGIGVVMAMTAPATNATDTNIIGVVNDRRSAGIAASTYGQVQVKGFCDVNGVGVVTGTVAANDNVEVIDAGTSFIDQGTNGGSIVKTNTVGTVIEAIDATHASIWLHGRAVSIEAA